MSGEGGQRQQTVEAVALTGGKRGRHAALEGALAGGGRVRLFPAVHHR
jgi:hypothetical protein